MSIQVQKIASSLSEPLTLHIHQGKTKWRIHVVINSTQNICWRILLKYIISMLFRHQINTERRRGTQRLSIQKIIILYKKPLKFVLRGELKMKVFISCFVIVNEMPIILGNTTSYLLFFIFSSPMTLTKWHVTHMTGQRN